MRSKAYILIFLSSLFGFGLSKFEVKACGYMEFPWESQMMMFRAQLPNMQALQMFYYTQDLYYDTEPDPQQNDRFRNCVEWQDQTDRSVSWDDIYVILYKTEPDEFIEAYNKNALNDFYPGNTFIDRLSKPENKELSDYLLFAKQVESTEEYILFDRFESWNWNTGTDNEAKYKSQKAKFYTVASDRVKKAKTSFLKERYAYQVCRLGYQLKKYKDVEQAYDTYFKELNTNSLMNVWSLLFKAQSIDVTGRKQDANILYSSVFDNSDEKKFRCIQMFNFKEEVPENLNTHQQSVMYVMKMINFPGRALDSLRLINKLDAKSQYLPFLVMREINKLEDWILTPEYYKSAYDRYSCYFDKNRTSFEPNDQTNENLITDMDYLKTLKSFISELRQAAKERDNKDFYSLALAHLSLMEENDKDAQKYLSDISGDASPAVLLQKELEDIWLAMNTRDITKDAFKDYFIKHIGALRNISVENFDNDKMLYSLTLKLSKDYLNKNDVVTGNLLQMKSEQFRTALNDYDYQYHWYYGDIQQFDQNASVADMDKLLALLSKKKRSDFESFLCDQTMGSIDVYKDLKGTIAFRESDLKTAYETFASMSQDFWEKTYEFGAYLNEDPFFPKGLKMKKERDFTYKFNKTDFVKTLIDLETEAAKDKNVRTDNYLRLGNAYFNCSYWGNSWMMSNYGQSVGDVYYTDPDCAAPWELANYYTCDIAGNYYKKALDSDASDEQKAFASLMLYRCNFLKYSYNATYEKEKDVAKKYATDFYSTYKKTKTFKDFQCPGIDRFLAGKLPKRDWY